MDKVWGDTGRKGEDGMHMNKSGLWLVTVLLSLLFIPLLSISQVQVTYGLDDSSMLVTVSDEKFHVKIDLDIQLSIDDYTQFIDTEDAYSRDAATFRGKLRESIEDAIQELVSDATVPSIDIDSVECYEGSGKMHVELSFDVEGAITTLTNGGRRYDLKWRSFKADNKFSCEGRTVSPHEGLGLDFSGFEDDLDDSDEWSVEESGENTVIRQKREYELDVDDGEVDLRVTQKFTLPNTGLKIDDDIVEYEQVQQTTQQTAQQEQPKIPGFPWEGIVAALFLATGTIILRRTRKISCCRTESARTIVAECYY